MNSSKKESYSLLERTLIILRQIVKDFDSQMDDSEIFNILTLIRDIEKEV